MNPDGAPITPRLPQITPSHPTSALYSLGRTDSKRKQRKGVRRIKKRPAAAAEARSKARGGKRRSGIKKAKQVVKPVKPQAAVSGRRRGPRGPKLNDDPTVYEVERIIGAVCANNGSHYVLVKWTGYGDSENTWELLSKMQKGTPEAVKSFFRQYKKPTWGKNCIVLSPEGKRHEERQKKTGQGARTPRHGGNQ